MKLVLSLILPTFVYCSFALASEQLDPNEGSENSYTCADENCTTKEPSQPAQPDYCETGRGCSPSTNQTESPKPKQKKKMKPHYYCDAYNPNDCIVVYK